MAKEKVAGRVWASARYKNKELSSESLLEVRKFETTPAVVKAGYALTLNLGNYESAKVDAGVELPCYVEEVPDAFKEAWKLAEDEIQRQVKELRESQRKG